MTGCCPLRTQLLTHLSGQGVLRVGVGVPLEMDTVCVFVCVFT